MACDVCQGRNEHLCPICGSRRIEEPIECPECKGYGIVDCFAMNVETEDYKEVTVEEYLALPDEHEASVRGLIWCKDIHEVCQCCRGEGKVYYWEGEYYPIR